VTGTTAFFIVPATGATAFFIVPAKPAPLRDPALELDAEARADEFRLACRPLEDPPPRDFEDPPPRPLEDPRD
jgi:hypothetical protein